MSRVEIATQAWGWVADTSGNGLAGQVVTIKNLDGSNATHWDAVTGGTSSTGTITTSADGTIPRFIDSGSYNTTINAVTHRVEATAGRPLFNARNYMGFADPVQEAINAAIPLGGAEIEVPAGVWIRPAGTPLTIPNFMTVRGQGQSTIIRANGNHYAISFNPGNRSRLSNMTIETASTQTSGGGIDWTSAGSNTFVDHIYFSTGLFISCNIAPAQITSVHMLSDLRWNGGTNYNTAFRIGDGTNLITDISIRQFKGTASTTADMATWFDVARKVDTLTVQDGLLYRGGVGMLLGSRGATGSVTGMEVDQLIVDQMSGIGIDGVNITDATFGPGCMVQTCGTTTEAGLRAGAGVTMLRYTGTIRNGTGDGVLIQDGSKFVRILGAEIYDNNSVNAANVSGITVAANADLWEINDCLIGNQIIGTGHQKYGVLIQAGDSNLWHLVDNRFYRNETLPLLDGATGNFKRIQGNYGVNAAGTGLDIVSDFMYGQITLRDSSGVDRILMVNTGWTRWVNTFAANPVIDVRGAAAQTAPIAQFNRDTTRVSQVNSQGAFVSDVAAQGIVLKDTQATPHYWRITVGNTGVLASADLGTTRPD